MNKTYKANDNHGFLKAETVVEKEDEQAWLYEMEEAIGTKFETR